MPAMNSDWQSALIAKSEYFRNWTGRDLADAAELTWPCPECRGKLICAFVYDNTSSPEYYYSHSAHVCLNPQCSHIEERDTHQGIDEELAPVLRCAICGR